MRSGWALGHIRYARSLLCQARAACLLNLPWWISSLGLCTGTWLGHDEDVCHFCSLFSSYGAEYSIPFVYPVNTQTYLIYCSDRKKLGSEKGQVAHPRSQLGPDLRSVSLAPLFVAFGVSKS